MSIKSKLTKKMESSWKNAKKALKKPDPETVFQAKLTKGMKEEILKDLSEAKVHVNTERWQRSHGPKQPRGYGSWIFTKHSGGVNFDKGHKEHQDHVIINGSYGHAKKQATDWAKFHQIHTIHVAESYKGNVPNTLAAIASHAPEFKVGEHVKAKLGPSGQVEKIDKHGSVFFRHHETTHGPFGSHKKLFKAHPSILHHINGPVQEETLDEVKAGPLKTHPWIGKKVNITNGPHAGKTGTVHGVEREHTFSQLVPYKTVLHVTHDDGTKTYGVRKEHASPLKEDIIASEADIQAVLNEATHGPTRMQIQRTWDNAGIHSNAARIAHVEKVHNIHNLRVTSKGVVVHYRHPGDEVSEPRRPTMTKLQDEYVNEHKVGDMVHVTHLHGAPLKTPMKGKIVHDFGNGLYNVSTHRIGGKKSSSSYGINRLAKAEHLKAVTEEVVNELSKKTLGSYVKKAKGKEYSDYAKKDFSDAMKHRNGVDKATKKLTKEEALDETATEKFLNKPMMTPLEKVRLKMDKKRNNELLRQHRETQKQTKAAHKHFYPSRNDPRYESTESTGVTLDEAKKPAKKGKVARKYLGAQRGKTATGKPAHAIEISPVIGGDDNKNKTTVPRDKK